MVSRRLRLQGTVNPAASASDKSSPGLLLLLAGYRLGEAGMKAGLVVSGNLNFSLPVLPAVIFKFPIKPGKEDGNWKASVVVTTTFPRYP